MPLTVVVTNVGRAIYNHMLKGTAGYQIPQYIGWGTSATVAARTQTTLGTESSQESRVAGTTSVATTTTTDDTFRVVGTLTVATSNKNITEAAVFDAASGGRMFLKATFDALALNVGDQIQFTFDSQLD